MEKNKIINVKRLFIESLMELYKEDYSLIK